MCSRIKNFFSIRNCAILLIVLGVFYMISTFVLMAVIGPMVHVELAKEFTDEFANTFSGIYTLTGVLISIATGGLALIVGVISLICNRRSGQEMVCMVLGAIAAINGLWSVFLSLQSIGLEILFPLIQAGLGCVIILRAKEQRDNNKYKI